MPRGKRRERGGTLKTKGGERRRGNREGEEVSKPHLDLSYTGSYSEREETLVVQKGKRRVRLLLPVHFIIFSLPTLKEDIPEGRGKLKEGKRVEGDFAESSLAMRT